MGGRGLLFWSCRRHRARKPARFFKIFQIFFGGDEGGLQTCKLHLFNTRVNSSQEGQSLTCDGVTYSHTIVEQI